MSNFITSMASGMMKCQEAANKPNPMLKVFDWDKAKQILEARGWPDAGVGLKEDWFWTGDTLCVGGSMIPETECRAYLRSLWATPVIRIQDEVIECWKEVPYDLNRRGYVNSNPCSDQESS